ncbi:sigma factor-like helix-turn-helix DNA-binding protein [Streptomyces sp. 21So2-11]|uniref:sigma factor-like helix-turn-helix DNA-binding protein n=1 Tax=Streptomyces sp. 21So2-11 TaxID=3144408 RepID=UPI0032191D28
MPVDPLTGERGPAATVADHDEAERLLGTLPSNVLKILRMTAESYSLKEIADTLGATERAAQSRLLRARQRVNARLSARHH